MHTTTELLDEISLKHGECSDYRIAKLLGVPQTSVSNWRTGRRVMSPDFGTRVASLLGWDAAYVMACLEHERVEKARIDGKDPLEDTGEILATWARIAAKFRPKAAAILAALMLPALGWFSEPAQAVTHPGANFVGSPVYTLCAIRGWLENRRRRRKKKPAPTPPPPKKQHLWRTEFPICELSPLAA